MNTPTDRDWNDAFANMAHVAGSENLPQQWAEQADAYRRGGVRLEEHSYGEHQRERLDIIWPDEVPVGLAVFVHGGYWMRLDKSFWTHLAEGARARGWAVCLPSYTLAPEVRISSMTLQIGAAIERAASLIAGPIRLSGHSAGGHLITRMLCRGTPLSADTLGRVEHGLSISGIHDLRPLLRTSMNDTLQLDMNEATQESPVLHTPADSSPLTMWVGGGERPEFIRQSQLMAQMWDGLDISTTCVIDPHHNHFTVIEGLNDKASAITTAFCG